MPHLCLHPLHPVSLLPVPLQPGVHQLPPLHARRLGAPCLHQGLGVDLHGQRLLLLLHRLLPQQLQLSTDLLWLGDSSRLQRLGRVL